MNYFRDLSRKGFCVEVFGCFFELCYEMALSVPLVFGLRVACSSVEVAFGKIKDIRL